MGLSRAAEPAERGRAVGGESGGRAEAWATTAATDGDIRARPATQAAIWAKWRRRGRAPVFAPRVPC